MRVIGLNLSPENATAEVLPLPLTNHTAPNSSTHRTDKQVSGEVVQTVHGKEKETPKHQKSTSNLENETLRRDYVPMNETAVGEATGGREQRKMRSKVAIEKPREIQKMKKDESHQTKGCFNVYLLVDSNPQKMVAFGSVVNAELDLDTAVLPCGPQRKLIKLRLTKVF